MTVEETVERVRDRTFHLAVQTAGVSWEATCFYVARLLPSKRIIVATARHAIEFESGSTATWTVRRFSEDGACSGELTFETVHDEETKRPYRHYKHADVGFVVLPPPDYPSSGTLVPDDLEPLTVLEETRRVVIGTRVGWAGFPGIVGQHLGAPTLCYFDGVVSAFHAQGSRGVYLVDGHNSRGVSGGPVFHWRDEDHRPEVVGIVSGYGCADAELPGMCVFEPINPIIAFLKGQYSAKSQ